ncbi:MAG: hypothetical protein OYI31_06550, partial [Chloroflexota bacterium]|nr:hypothetical protein [Chloroflexota bacterium]
MKSMVAAPNSEMARPLFSDSVWFSASFKVATLVASIARRSSWESKDCPNCNWLSPTSVGYGRDERYPSEGVFIRATVSFV